MKVRVNVHIFQYDPGDIVEMDKGWTDIFLKGGQVSEVNESEEVTTDLGPDEVGASLFEPTEDSRAQV
jgi:hypothetical protein